MLDRDKLKFNELQKSQIELFIDYFTLCEKYYLGLELNVIKNKFNNFLLIRRDFNEL